MAARPITSVLVVDDEPDLRTLYELTLLREGYQVVAAGNLAQAREWLAQQRFDVLITDMRLPDGLGLELLHALNTEQRPERSIVITAYGSAENAVEALKIGAFDYLTKPVDLKQLRAVVSAALLSQCTRSGVPIGVGRTVQHSGASPAPGAGAGVSALMRIVGQSDCIRQIKARIEKMATSMAPVLILGESGTGKELVARAVHGCSHRAAGPFVAVNCGAIPDNLIESEFFGVRKGAFTGASQDRDGFFQAARGGTLFLDEIGDLPLAMQAKLLRVIQERRVRPLGGVPEETVDMRLVSATHRDLAARVASGEFRQDLYYRLNVIELRTPALRERSDDLPALVQALLRRLCDAPDSTPPEVSPAALAWLQARELPGNVRELENLLQRALALSNGQTLEPIDFGAHETHGSPPAAARSTASTPKPTAASIDLPGDLQVFLDEQERKVLIQALKEADFNRTAAAARLGLNLRQMRYRIQRLGIAMPSDQALDDADTA
jgi:two-component system response regulator PilR (NtrC family)